MRTKLLIFCLVIFIWSCTRRFDYEIRQISVLYIPGQITTPQHGGGCGYKFSNNLSIDTVIEKQDVLTKIQDLISNLKVQKDSITDVDTRIYCKIEYSNGNTSNLYLGKLYGICLDGKVMHENQELQNLIKEHIGYFYYLKNEKSTYNFFKKRRKEYIQSNTENE